MTERGVERRRAGGRSPWELHVEDRLDTQDEKLDELISLFKGSKIALAIISGCAGLAASVAVIWHNLVGQS